MSNHNITIYDTTLGTALRPKGFLYSQCKTPRGAKLDQFGIDYIEGGWPGSNPRDMAFFEKAAELNSSTRKSRRSVRLDELPLVEEDPQIKLLLDAATPVVTIFGKSWLLHATGRFGLHPKKTFP